MKFSTTAIATCMAMAASPIWAAIVDFDSIASGTNFAAGSDFSGISFDQTIRVEALAAFATFPGTSGNQAFVAASKTVDFAGFFANPVSMFRIAIGDGCCDTDRVTLTGFNAIGAVVDSASYAAQSGQFLELNGPGIVRFQVAQQGSGVIFDTISFTLDQTAAVPLPAALPLAGMGLFGLAALRRRARRKDARVTTPRAA